ncbi:hypothetical protein [Spongiactinospora rosea]|uniref:hypothetical protein n=1 Tax=Spongiactinospora rosea TaxID=2248750 RepID=UPI0018F67A9B|nr:hypothetical protein [Spongiactinospora rosea]
MLDAEPQPAGGKVLWHFTMSLATGISARPGLIDEYVQTTGAVLGGRDGWDASPGSRPYGGAWKGPIFVLTLHSEGAVPADGVMLLNCGPAEAVRIGLEAAGGKNLETAGMPRLAAARTAVSGRGRSSCSLTIPRARSLPTASCC